MDFKKILSASLMIMGIGVVLVIIQGILDVVAVLAPADVGPVPLGLLLTIIKTGYWLLSFLLFAGLYFWAGMRAVKSYGLDPMSGGVISALSHAVVCIISIIVNIVVGLVGAGGFALNMAGQGGAMGGAVGALLGGLGFMVGGAITLVIGGVCLVGGIILNFGLGFGGGTFAEKKTVPEKNPEPEKKAEKKPEKAEKK
ncbi:hypothetical protein H0O00_03210 [Candidatus Micrarchaeota archaeon]|nr:hypothetical protein [Candidatus Micrarchaeota archaeon]